ncbi:HAD family hydrolase [Vibrio mediterranei]|uniref:ATPase P n=1 Tax=Vibrio mediterranei TaxID=689 RepID=A0ABX5DAH3_9VIBR|nr:HAD family hydrolase [Vibrio mediterranei]MCG9660675.1 HAD family hydrolase [Vibrio mediterranei]PCD88446.1 hypothetical protein COR52_11570 [Vibrio mediterranei]PRQ66688.1 hypothetical protein COR51_15845 [Vibrio mediterranei]PTC05381.1 hypothetical protein C9980_09070 [Vibrio mediterranei]SBO07984.1 hypothetical protein VME0621_00070 [Vibrio mediterranei]
MSIEIPIPNWPKTIKTVYFGFDGTLAEDGKLIGGVENKLRELASLVDIYVLTADTFGTAKDVLSSLPVNVVTLDHCNTQRQKSESMFTPSSSSVAIGRGLNDVLMLEKVTLGIVVQTAEGVHPKALMRAELISNSIHEAIDLLLNPKRLVSGCRI